MENHMMVMETVYKDGVLKPSRPLNLADQSVVHIQITDKSATEHPHVMRQEGVHGGRPVIRGTRIPVKTLVRYVHMGMSAPEILAGFPDLTTAQLYDALSYYYDNQAEMEADIAAADQSTVLDRFGLQMDAKGRLIASQSS
jgi:uncharacterized protein (DUF433 family)